jgi:hypothetical protein
MEIPLQSDTDAAISALRDAEAAEAAAQAQMQAAYDKWQAANEQMRLALARSPAPSFPPG